jgi:hypothetical protein
MKRKDAEELMNLINRYVSVLLFVGAEESLEFKKEIEQKLESLITEDENEKKKEG